MAVLTNPSIKHVLPQTTFSPNLQQNPQFKRVFDIIFSIIVIMGILPLYAMIYVIIKLLSPEAPVIYTQARVGQNGTVFHMLKFRTMIPNADKLLAQLLEKNPALREEYERDFKLRNDPRILPGIGHLLRKTSLDELPQFFNVLKGDMSVVGPRPMEPQESQKYGDTMAEVLSVKPGITGIWQVSGRSRVSKQKKLTMDVYYARHHNLKLDAQLILRTVGLMFTGYGAC